MQTPSFVNANSANQGGTVRGIPKLNMFKVFYDSTPPDRSFEHVVKNPNHIYSDRLFDRRFCGVDPNHIFTFLHNQ